MNYKLEIGLERIEGSFPKPKFPPHRKQFRWDRTVIQCESGLC